MFLMINNINKACSTANGQCTIHVVLELVCNNMMTCDYKAQNVFVLLLSI